MAPFSKDSEATARAVATPRGSPGIEHRGPLGPADWLSLAAAPTFISMAFVTLFAEKTDVLCSADQGALPMTGMSLMYLLMGAFHLAPWLRLAARVGAGKTRASRQTAR